MNEDVGRQIVASPRSEVPPVIHAAALPSSIKVSLVGLFMLTLTGALYFAKDFLLPVSLAFLFALVLSPVVRFFAKRHVPAPVTAFILVTSLFGAVAAGSYFLTGPVSHWIDNAPRLGWQLRDKIAALRQPVEAVKQASEQVDQLTRGNDPGVQRVVVKEPGLMSRAASGLPELAAHVTLTLVLLLFLLASGDLFYEKLVKALPTLSDKKRALRIARDVEHEVSRYLFTVFLINLSLGIWIGLGMYLIGLPNPILWGIAAALLNFIPYLGAVVGICLVTVVGLVSFDDIGYALLAPVFYLVSAVIEGQFMTPWIVGKRLELNTVVVFLAVAFWGWLWG
ncbi:MAG: AI-2E family transporter, partial [Pseudomonadota bacterium]|nr:AI-2E family transporter [Pseudomonadota bacterium]